MVENKNQSPYLSELIQDFLEYMEVEQNRSKHTIVNYELYLNRLVEFADDVPINKINTDVIKKWRLWLNRLKDESGNELGVSTRNYHLIALRKLLKYCAKNDIEAINAEKIELARSVRKEVTFLNDDEVERLFNAVDVSSDIGIRDRAILELLYSSGLRVSELVNLNREHINLERGEFSVRGKRQKDRPVFISQYASDWISKYLKIRKDNTEPLFIRFTKGRKKEVDNSGNYTRLTARSIQRIVHHYAMLAGITKQVSPHTLRHSFATNLLMNGADIRSVQDMLGHSNISTTQVYTHITDPHLKMVHSKFHRNKTE
jgi:site-specific recombinase XerD